MPRTSGARKYLLDTSVFYERIKLDTPEFLAKLDQVAGGQRFGAYYSIIELNAGLLKTWVDFYKLVENYQDVPSAISQATNWWGRSSTSVGILHALNARMNSVVSCSDVDRYLDYLEASISTSVIIFEDMVKQFIGEFSAHPLARFYDMHRGDFDRFLSTCTDHKIVHMGAYLEDQKENLQDLSKYIDEEITKHNTSRNRSLKALVGSAVISPLDTERPTNNRKYGDLLIALNAPNSQIVISKDTAFDILCSGLGKKYLNF
jgi:hypothetical protein